LGSFLPIKGPGSLTLKKWGVRHKAGGYSDHLRKDMGLTIKNGEVTMATMEQWTFHGD
jgi:hypothetical protein